MKTEKQIQLLQEQKGKELAEQIGNFDSIKVKTKDAEKWFLNFPDDEDIVCTPIMKSGILTIVENGGHGYVIFDVDFQDDHCVIRGDIFDDIDGTYKWNCSANCRTPYSGNNKKMEYMITGYEDATTKIMEKQDRKQSEIDAYATNIMGKTTRPLSFLLKTMCYINWLMQHPEYKEVETKEIKETKLKESRKQIKNHANVTTEKRQTNHVHTIQINNIRFKTKNSNVVRGLRSSKRRMSLSCWGVRGHFRHYKNGKVVYIKPYTKGKGSKTERKEYTVK